MRLPVHSHRETSCHAMPDDLIAVLRTCCQIDGRILAVNGHKFNGLVIRSMRFPSNCSLV